jgi:uncharacterized pyridoxal phosphate-containing UPF0001 family protein
MARADRGHPGIALHLVGQLQSNKAEEAVRLFDASTRSIAPRW